MNRNLTFYGLMSGASAALLMSADTLPWRVFFTLGLAYFLWMSFKEIYEVK